MKTDVKYLSLVAEYVKWGSLHPYIFIKLKNPQMKKLFLSAFLILSICIPGLAQTIQSPSEFLGYELGSQFTFHYKAVEYFNKIAETSPKAVVKQYGTTNEGRPLIVCFVSSEENINKLETLRTNNLKNIGLLEGDPGKDHKPFIWLSYNVHGNESVGMETSMKTLFTLVSEEYDGVSDWLDKCVVVIDPCQNPDGRDLYTSRYKRTQPVKINPNSSDWSHSQGWPSARLNHYLFDLNRDWSWQTQVETEQKIKFYNTYMPHVHADFHEMGSESTYFFAPGADPWHKVITPWQHEFHKLTGMGNAELFDEKSMLYFTKESFDLFCPSFGDTWPLFNGAMGFTYEQGGGGRAGLAITRSVGDTLTLADRIEGHFLSSMATIKVSYENRERLLKEFIDFFRSGTTNPTFEYSSIIIKTSNNKFDIKSLCELLEKNQVNFSYAGNIGKSYEGFDYLANKKSRTTIEKGDILVSAYQPQSHFVEVLFEPDSKFTDSLSYDLTAWALPYIYNLKAYAIKERIRSNGGEVNFKFEKNKKPDKDPYAYLVNWKGFGDIKLMASLFDKKINIRYASKPFTIGGKSYNRGSLIIARGDNKRVASKFDEIVLLVADQNEISLSPVYTGFADKGIDLGSNYARLNKPPKIGIIGGTGTSQGSFGELWYFFEQELGYPHTIIRADNIPGTELNDFDVIFLPSGTYSKAKKKLMQYVKDGGRLVAFERSISLFASDSSTNISAVIKAKKKEKSADEKKIKSDDPSHLKKFENQRRERLNSRSASSVYRVRLDNTHPYVYGLGTEWFIIKRSDGYPYLSKGNNIAYITEGEPVAGFAGTKFIKNIKNTLVIGSEQIGRGEIIYITDDPYFRAFWKSGRLILGNIAFR